MVEMDDDGRRAMEMQDRGKLDSVKAQSVDVKWTQPRDVGARQAMCSKLRSITGKRSRRRWRVNCLVDAGAMQSLKVYGQVKQIWDELAG